MILSSLKLCKYSSLQNKNACLNLVIRVGVAGEILIARKVFDIPA